MIRKSSILLLLFLFVTSCQSVGPFIKQLDIKIVEDPTQKFVHMSLYHSLSESPDKEKAGIGCLLLSMLINGDNEKYTSTQTRRWLADHQTQLDYGCTNDYGMMAAVFPKDYIEEIVPVIREIIFNNKLSEKSLQSSRQNFMVKLSQRTEFDQTMNQINHDYFEDHPYSNAPSGTAESLQTITLADIQEFYQKNIIDGNLTLIAAGAITEDEVKKYFSSSKYGREGVDSHDLMESFHPNTRDPVYFSNKQKSLVLYSNVYVNNQEEAVTLNILKEMLKKALTQQIRVNDGLAYIMDVSAGMGQLSTFSIRIVSDDLVLSLTRAKEELQKLQLNYDGSVEKNRRDSVRALLTQFYLQLENPAQLSGFMGEGRLLGYDMDRLLDHFDEGLVQENAGYQSLLNELLLNMKPYIMGDLTEMEKDELSRKWGGGYGG